MANARRQAEVPRYDTAHTVIDGADRKKRYTATTDEDGIARFSVPKLTEYEIEAALTGFKKGLVKSVLLASGPIQESDGKVRLHGGVGPYGQTESRHPH